MFLKVVIKKNINNNFLTEKIGSFLKSVTLVPEQVKMNNRITYLDREDFNIYFFHFVKLLMCYSLNLLPMLLNTYFGYLSVPESSQSCFPS